MTIKAIFYDLRRAHPTEAIVQVLFERLVEQPVALLQHLQVLLDAHQLEYRALGQGCDAGELEVVLAEELVVLQVLLEGLDDDVADLPPMDREGEPAGPTSCHPHCADEPTTRQEQAPVAQQVR